MLETLREQLGDQLIEIAEHGGELKLEAIPSGLARVCRFLRDTPEFDFDYPADLTAWDTGEQLVLWLRLYSHRRNATALVRVTLPRVGAAVPTLTGIWPGTDWHERECFDLYGIRFNGHPDQHDPARMRILLPEDWEGHPFLKDYSPVFSGDPLHGPQETN